MKGKTLAVALIGMAISFIGAYSVYLSPLAAQWLGSIAMLLTIILQSSIFATPGTSWPTGWKWFTWATNGIGIVILWFSTFADMAAPLIAPEVITGVIMGLNIVLSFIKNYPGPGGESALGKD